MLKNSEMLREHQTLMLNSNHLPSPKRSIESSKGWQGFFPYYAGFPEIFADAVLQKGRLGTSSLVLDPWNGSGTTTYVASSLGLNSIGLDINPVMVVVAKARLLPATESSSLEPLGAEIIREAEASICEVAVGDPLSHWFGRESATFVRAIERSISRHLVGAAPQTPKGTSLDRLSGIAAANYVALFSTCRDLAARFRSSNPTWLRKPRAHERKIGTSGATIAKKFQAKLRAMAQALATRANLFQIEQGAEIRVADTANIPIPSGSIDFILTSPPYCTRIDYTAATRIELDLLFPLMGESPEELGRRMVGSTRVPSGKITASKGWGTTCIEFLDALHAHPSKASSTYYHLTHLDYFDKMYRSLKNITQALSSEGHAVMVVQDSFYKELHNDLPKVITEMVESLGLPLKERRDFRIQRTMAGINPGSRTYKRPAGATESVLHFAKS